MTSIVAWAGIDPRGPSSIYIASDSRISWPHGTFWDQGRKVFACINKPHIFGYWGDVLFPALAIPVLVDRLDRGYQLDQDGSSDFSFERTVRSLWKDYPSEQRNDLGIIHAHRIGMGMGSTFALKILRYSASSQRWSTSSVPMPDKSSFLHIAGSGANAVRSTRDLWQASEHSDTSRAAFSALCEALKGKIDPKSGGAPQLCGLYRGRGAGGHMFGVTFAGQRYFAGAHLPGDDVPSDIEWRNELFELVEGKTKKRLPGAQKHQPR